MISKETVKEVVFKHGADLCGIASVDRRKIRTRPVCQVRSLSERLPDMH